jgi:hypothetical protein
MLRIWEVTGSIVGMETWYPDWKLS